MSQIFQLLESLSESFFLSGCESACFGSQITKPFSSLNATVDHAGNLLIQKKSDQENAKNILIEAHLDQIGLCVCEILDGGFISVCTCGGFDQSILPGTEFIIHSSDKYKAIASSLPPHLKKKDGEQKNKIYLDCGFSSADEAKKHVTVGSPVSFASACEKLLGDAICAPALDNKAGVAAAILTAMRVQSPHNLSFLFTLGEETTSRGVKRMIFDETPDLALVIDAGFGFTKGLNPDQCIEVGQGPSISIADTLSRSLANWVIDVAKANQLKMQTVVEPGGTGSSATTLQLRYGGIPCGLISIPLKYMHTPSEIVSESDIEATVQLLCKLLEQKDFGEVFSFGA